KRIGLDAARLERDMNSAAVRDRIQQDISFAQQAEVSDVPTVFLNGRIIGAWGRDELWQYFLRFPPDPKPATASAPAR
ncbi:MAG TPA: DsbA family protein, partial [Phycisphaerae bacterium]|nr:DsbA family protein [Phycisphaerae bacterium]